jgi:hypothetical protein
MISGYAQYLAALWRGLKAYNVTFTITHITFVKRGCMMKNITCDEVDELVEVGLASKARSIIAVHRLQTNRREVKGRSA